MRQSMWVPEADGCQEAEAPAHTHIHTRIEWVWSVYCHSLPAEASHRSTFCVHPRATKQCLRLKICNGEKAELEWPAQRAWNLDCPVADFVYYTYPISWWHQRHKRKKARLHSCHYCTSLNSVTIPSCDHTFIIEAIWALPCELLSSEIWK